ncbi:MAG: NADH-quinone oxidoreductase subunit L [Anaerolineales bacterium]
MAESLFALVPWIVFAPVIGLLINIFLPYKLKLLNKWFGTQWEMSENAIGIIATLASATTFVVALLQAYALTIAPAAAFAAVVSPVSGPLAWIHVGALQIDWAFRVDTLSAMMMLVVSGVGTLIHIYAIGYMREDVRFKGDAGRYGRFFVFLNLFIAAMMVLVSGNSYLMLFVGWEGVGLCSFLLIGFWYEMDTLGRPSWANSDAAKKAFIVNRIGDFGFLVAAFLMFTQFHSLQFDEVFKAAQTADPALILAITIFLLIGVTGKSAQIPLYVWLPDAMAGPTPVSALIHAATMVTAGVYLVTRSAPIFSLSHNAQVMVSTVGALTALFAATIAVGQYDIKKVLAYSTISQLGFMVAAVGMGGYVAGMFHLATHAFFKALLFLSAGSVILGMERGHHHLEHSNHAVKDWNNGHHGETAEVFDPGDMRNMGGLRKQMPVTFWVYIIGALALAGIWPLAGFWSKDEILAEASKNFPLVYWLLIAAAFLTAFYMGRQVWMVFFGQPRHEVAGHAEESPLIMTIPLMVLAALAVFGGLLNLPGLDTLHKWLAGTIKGIEPGQFNLTVAVLSTVLALAAIGLSWLLYQRKPLEAGQPDPLKKWLGPVFTGMEHKWFVDEIYQFVFADRYDDLALFLAQTLDWDFWHNWLHDSVIARGFVGFARFLADPVDLGFVDRISYWLSDLIRNSSEALRRLQNGFVRSYALSVLVGVVVILGYLLLK